MGMRWSRLWLLWATVVALHDRLLASRILTLQQSQPLPFDARDGMATQSWRNVRTSSRNAFGWSSMTKCAALAMSTKLMLAAPVNWRR